MEEAVRDKVFFSYSHADVEWLEKLTTILSPAVRNKRLSLWYDKHIEAGTKWREAIKHALSSAKVAVLLVSPTFLSSDFITDHELPDLLNAARTDGVTILWIALTASLVDETEISSFEAAHDPSKPLDTLNAADLNSELVKIARKIQHAAKGEPLRHDLGSVAGPSAHGLNPTETYPLDSTDFLTGAQGSIYVRAKKAFEESAFLLHELVSLDPEADERDIAEIKETIKIAMSKLLKELSKPLGPSVSEVNSCFRSLLGPEKPSGSSALVEADPERIGGSLGLLRNVCGLSLYNGVFVSTLDDERNATNFRIIADYIICIAQSWAWNSLLTTPLTPNPTFRFQLFFILNALSELTELCGRLRSALADASISSATQRTLLIQFPDQLDGKPFSSSPIFLHDLLSRLEHFASEEGPRLLRRGSKFVFAMSFVPELTALCDLMQCARRPTNSRSLPNGYQAADVQRAFWQTSDHLKEVLNLAKVVATHDVGSGAVEPSPDIT
jgi:TIR domain